MADLSNKVVLITGANSGIGLEASVKLARLGAQVVMVGRSREKLDAAVKDVTQRAASSQVTPLLCDFSSQASIRALAGEFRKAYGRLDILVNNAGAVSPTRQVTVDGFEQTFAVNHLGYFLLTNLLLDLLKAAAPSRIVNVSSVGHRGATLDFDNLQLEKGYTTIRAYNNSKLANVLFTRELAKKLKGTGVIVNSLHPGVVATQIWNRAPWFMQPLLPIVKLFMLSAEKGGDTIVHLATSPEVEGKTGGYYEKNRLIDPHGRGGDDALAEKLWSVSAQLCAGTGATA